MTAVAVGADTVLDELYLVFGGDYTREEIDVYLAHAKLQLRGSIAAESLPEMAARLVAYRLRRSG